MALNFPDSPTLNQVYTDSISGFSYQWNGTVWISFSPASTGNIRVLDDISGSFNGSTQTFALTSSSIAISPPNPQSVIVNLGGVVQDPSDDYIISGSTITFTTPPASGLTFSGVVLGVAVPVGVSTGDAFYRQIYSPIGVQTSFAFINGYGVGYLDVYHNGAKLVPSLDYTATDGLNFSLVTPAQAGDNVEAIGYRVTSVAIVNGSVSSLTVSGNALVAGITTLGTVGYGGTALDVNGNLNFTGSLNQNGSPFVASRWTSGTGDNIYRLNGNVGIGTTNPTSKLSVTGDANFTGVVTATSFSGDGSNLSGIAAAKGGGTDKIFFENDQTVTADYTITTNKNAMTAGPVAISTGITITIPSGSTWTIV